MAYWQWSEPYDAKREAVLLGTDSKNNDGASKSRSSVSGTAANFEWLRYLGMHVSWLDVSSTLYSTLHLP